MKLHNFFLVEQDGSRVFAENTVTNAGKHLINNLAYAAYLVLESGGQTIVRKTELVKICRDISKGTLSAGYRCILGENEFAGFTFTRLGFSPYEDGHETANRAELAGVTKELGHALIITGIVYVSLEADGAFFGGENPLSDFLLGHSPLAGNDFYAAPYSFKDGAPAGAKVMMNKNSTANGFRLLASGVAAGKDGVAIYMDSKPVLRLPCRVAGVTKTLSTTANTAGTAWAGGALATVSEVVQSGNILSGARVIRTPADSYGYKKINIKLGRKGCLLTEPGGNFFAAAGEKDVLLFSSEKIELIKIFKMRGQRAIITEDGAVAFFGDKLTICTLDGSETEYPVYCDGQAAIVNADGGGYYVYVQSGHFLMKYLIFSGETTLLGMTRAGERLCLFRFGRSLVSISGTDIDVSDSRGRDVAAEKTLASMLLGFFAGGDFDGEEGKLLVRASDGSRYVADLAVGSLVPVSSSITLAGGVFLVPRAEGTAICNFDYGQGYLKEILLAGGDTIDAVVCGDKIITKSLDGSLMAGNVVYGDTFVRHGDVAGQNLDIKVREDAVAAGGAVSVYFYF